MSDKKLLDFIRRLGGYRGNPPRTTGEFWVYVTCYDVYKANASPRKATVHTDNCHLVRNRKLKDSKDGVGTKSFWSAFDTKEDSDGFVRRVTYIDPNIKGALHSCVKGIRHPIN